MNVLKGKIKTLIVISLKKAKITAKLANILPILTLKLKSVRTNL